MTTFERAAERLRIWRDSPCQFVVDNFGTAPDPWQRPVLDSLADPAVKRIGLQAATGAGKTAVLAWSGLCNILATQGTAVDHPKGLAVSITGRNQKDNFGGELRKWLRRSAFLSSQFTATTERIVANAATERVLNLRSYPLGVNPDEQGTRISGHHAPYVFGIADESGSSGMPPPIGRAFEQMLAGCRWGKLMQAGNPVSRQSWLCDAANRLRHLWKMFKVTADPDDKLAWVHAPRVGPEPKQWAAEQIRANGRESPWVRAYILAEFPSGSFDALVSVEDVERAMALTLQPTDYQFIKPVIGVDTARFGDDRTALFARQGFMTWRPWTFRNLRTTEIAARVMKMAESIRKQTRHEPTILVDNSFHWGVGVIDNLVAAGLPAIGVNFADKAMHHRYRNRRAEMWLKLAEALKAGALRLPNTPELIAELTEPTYSLVNGQFQLEPKENIKRRLGRSPDLGDALALTFAIGDVAAGLAGQSGVGHAVVADDAWYDDVFLKRHAAPGYED